MSLLTLPNLYCRPSDVYDYMGTEGGQLRLDDHHEATAQTITVTVAAAPLAVSLSVFPLTQAILTGTVLEFDGGGMPAVVEVTTTQPARAGDAALAVTPLSATVNALAAAFDSGVNVALAARLVKACSYATAQVKAYCSPRYDDSQLAQSWSVNRWATTLACRWLGRRRGQSAPKGLEADAKETLEEMKMVRVGMLNIEDIGTRTSGWPFVSNCTVDLSYTYAKIRVEWPLSEGTPTQYPQHVDWNSALILEL